VILIEGGEKKRMANKRDVGGADDKKKKSTRRCRRTTSTVNHALVARWIQEHLYSEVPELGIVSEALIERILKASHRYYIQQGFSSIKLADK
jgi:hypothetical protein